MISISIVEDQPEIRSSLERLLNQQNDILLLSIYTNAEDAAIGIIEHQPDIVLMDINLPRMSGIECIQKIKERCPDTQFMIFTIYENDDKIFEALAAGATGYLLKKTPTEKIIESIKELHHGGSPMSSQIARKVLSYFNKKPTKLTQLTNKENEILDLLSKGFLYKEIASKLSIATGTVTQHVHHIYEKLQVSNKTEAINKYLGK